MSRRRLLLSNLLHIFWFKQGLKDTQLNECTCPFPEVTMAEEILSMTPENISKRKCQEGHCDLPSSTDGQMLITANNMKMASLLGGICVGVNSLSESTDTEILYLNPQTPKWSLVEKFAELSPAEDLGLHGDQNNNSFCTNKGKHGSSDTLLDNAHKKKKNSSKYLKSRKIQSDAAVKPKASKLKERNFGDNSSVAGANKPKKKNVNSTHGEKLAKKSEESKIPHLLVAMKKRSEVDTEQRPFKCKHCHWAFKKLCNLQSHLQTHTGLKPHVCDICGKAYSHQGTLQQHKRLHTGERPYHCPFCDKTYIWSSDYRKHIRTHTGEKPYVCDTCGKDFIRSSDLRKHERNMHTNDKPFPCKHCGKTFNKPLSLKRHERKHLGERPFSCPDCGKTFALASRMAEHQKIHRGVRPFVCSVCSKSFTKSSNLLEHETIHSGERPHKCSECGVSFAMASRLVRHQYVHSKEKPHSCTGCSKNFSQLASLKLHQEQTCSGRIFVCVDCNKSFQCSTKLSQHMLNHKEKNV